MSEDFIFTVCCPCCGSVVGKSYYGAKTFTHCSRCSADLYYEIKSEGIVVKVTKDPKHIPVAPYEIA